MSPSLSFRRATFCVVALSVSAACHHRSSPASGYVGSVRVEEEVERAGVVRAMDRPIAGASTMADKALANGEIPTSRIEDLFVGRYPGLDVQRTSEGGLAMRLRGAEPLVVIDGMEADPDALIGVLPQSVIRIEVLRNISETAIYGSRGVNGVVRVTTRR